MSGSWQPFWTPRYCKSGNSDPVNLIPIMHAPFKSQKPEANSLELSQQQQSQQQRTSRPPLQRYHTGPPSTYIHSLNLSFSQPGSYNISFNFNGEVIMAPEAAAQAAALAKPIKPVSDVSQTQRTPALGSTTKVEEPSASVAMSEEPLFQTAIANPFGNETESTGTFYGYGIYR